LCFHTGLNFTTFSALKAFFPIFTCFKLNHWKTNKKPSRKFLKTLKTILVNKKMIFFLAGLDKVRYNGYMEERKHLPDANRLSVISAVILLAYALIPFVKVPAQPIRLSLIWVQFDFNLNYGTLISLLAAILAGLGADWLLQGHPDHDKNSLLRHGFVPALTAWVIGVPLNTLEVQPAWWVVLALGGGLLVLVLVAEYIVIDLSGVAYLPASLGLTAVSFALYLVLAIALKAANVRLFLLLPALVPTLFLLVLRTLYLRSSGQWNWVWALGIALVVGQLAVGFHYLPIQPLTFGLLLVGSAYGLTAFASGLEEGREAWSLWFEPFFMLSMIWFLAWMIRG
jgi:hypothetical protein